MVSIHRPLGYGPSTLPLRHSAMLGILCVVLAYVFEPLLVSCSLAIEIQIKNKADDLLRVAKAVE